MADSVGVYSEELERSNSVNPVLASYTQYVTGVRLVRQPFLWKRIETAPGHLDFSVYDTVVTAAAFAHLAVLPVLMDPPPWHSTRLPSNRPGGMFPPRDPSAMARLATALVQRYGPRGRFWASHPNVPPLPIHSWQIWNEPNIPAYWRTGPDPKAYVRLLDAVGSAIRAADPGAEIVAAGLPQAGTGLPIDKFIDGMYAAGARGMFDTLAVHPYASDPAGVLDILWAARDQLDRLGDPGRPIWATEFGWATDGPEVTVTTSEAGQATMVRDVIALMQRARSALRLRGFVWFRWRDVPLNPGQNDIWALNTGLLREDGSAKPALNAFAAAAAAWFPEPKHTDAITSRPDARPSVAGVSRRTLRLRCFVRRGRLFVRVAVSPGGGKRRVRISYQAVRKGRVVVSRIRRVRTRSRRARVAFKLPRRARSAVRLRITATHGTARASRRLRLR